MEENGSFEGEIARESEPEESEMRSALEGKYLPEILSRRGEFTAWVLLLVVLVGWIILIVSGRSVPFAVYILAGFFLLAGLSISLGNWMDRRTFIEIKPEEIVFTNGLRFCQINWNDILSVEIHPSQWGKKVHVRARNSHFAFRMLGEVKVGGEIKGRMGFVGGDKILGAIIERSKIRLEKTTEMGDYYKV
jgi:hypothetical protein